MFEAAMLFGAIRSSDTPDAWRIILGAARLSTLLIMILAYLISRRDSVYEKFPDEIEGLLASDGRGAAYGTVSGKVDHVKEPAGKPNSGWLAYFIGFRILFPYIWYIALHNLQRIRLILNAGRPIRTSNNSFS
jgi:hypothetical protein